MNDHLKKMQMEWYQNSIRYTSVIGMTGRRPIQEEFQAVVDDLTSKFSIDEKGTHSILDVGCNNGHLLHQLAHSVPFKAGVDFCLQTLRKGKEIYPDICFVNGEITQLPFIENLFDRVLCYNMYHYLPSAEYGIKAASELYRVLKPNGEMLIGDLFTMEQKGLIPESDKKKWNSPDRPFMHRMENWMFMPIHMLNDHMMDLGAETRILHQNGPLRCSGYRLDFWARKKGI